MNLVETIVELKRIDTKFWWAEHNYWHKYDERLDKKEVMRHDDQKGLGFPEEA